MVALEAATRSVARLAVGAEGIRRLAVGMLLSLGAGSIGIACWSLASGGIGWDSRLDVSAAAITRSLGPSLSLSQAYDAVPATSEFYGVFIYQFADVLHLLTTGSTTSLGPDRWVTYLYLGAANLILSVAAVTALAVAVSLTFRSVLAGAFAWAVTLATPLWLGMSHVDFKDMPVAAGLTLVTAGLMFCLAVERPRKAALAGVLAAAPGGAIVLATRPGSLPLLVVLAGGTTILVLAAAIRRRDARSALPVVIASCSAFAGAVVFTWATTPIARIDMVQWLADAIRSARSYTPYSEPIRVAGQDVLPNHLPWWYVPAWLGAQLPILTLAAVAAGAAALVTLIVRRRRDAPAGATLGLLPIAIQGIAFPLVIVASGAVLYDGIRHLLFIVPPLLALAAAAFAIVDRHAVARSSPLRVVLPLAAVVVVSASLCASVRWAPYAYAYINPVAGHDPDRRSWELDFWGVSAREGIARLRRLGYASIYVEPSAMPGIPFGAVDDHVHPGAHPGTHVGLYVFLRWSRAADFGCAVVFTIKRDGHALGEGADCPG
jgi:hypothetical protein